MPLTLVSNSDHKRQEYVELLGVKDITRVPFTESEQVEDDLALLTRRKTVSAAALTNPPYFVEHTALYIKHFGDWPGTGTQPFLKRNPPQMLLQMMHDAKGDERKALAAIAIGYVGKTGANPVVMTSSVRGHIAEQERGENGFGWDCIFIPYGETRTYAEMTSKEKHSVSMRSLAATELLIYLQSDNIVAAETLIAKRMEWAKSLANAAGKAAAGEARRTLIEIITDWFGVTMP